MVQFDGTQFDVTQFDGTQFDGTQSDGTLAYVLIAFAPVTKPRHSLRRFSRESQILQGAMFRFWYRNARRSHNT